MLFLPVLLTTRIHPCIDASTIAPCCTRATSCSIVDISGTVTPSSRRVMHRILALPVCCNLPNHSYGRLAARLAIWGALTIGDVCQALPAATTWAPRLGRSGCVLSEVGPSDDQRTRVTSHTSSSMAWPPKAGPWSSIHGCAASVELALVRIACLVAMPHFACN